jgi:hypothetical protein
VEAGPADGSAVGIEVALIEAAPLASAEGDGLAPGVTTMLD